DSPARKVSIWRDSISAPASESFSLTWLSFCLRPKPLPAAHASGIRVSLRRQWKIADDRRRRRARALCRRFHLLRLQSSARVSLRERDAVQCLYGARIPGAQSVGTAHGQPGQYAWVQATRLGACEWWADHHEE